MRAKKKCKTEKLNEFDQKFIKKNCDMFLILS